MNPGITFPGPKPGSRTGFGQRLPLRQFRGVPNMAVSPSILDNRARGTRFGCFGVTTPRSDPMDSATSPFPEVPPRVSRRLERRRGLEELLAHLARHATDHSDPSSLRSLFEERLRGVLAVRGVHLRDASSRWVVPQELASAEESLAIDLPPGPSGGRGVLAVTLDPGRRLDEWDAQLLGVAAQVAALVLEIDRARLQPERPGPLAVRTRGEGAAARGCYAPY